MMDAPVCAAILSNWLQNAAISLALFSSPVMTLYNGSTMTIE